MDIQAYTLFKYESWAYVKSELVQTVVDQLNTKFIGSTNPVHNRNVLVVARLRLIGQECVGSAVSMLTVLYMQVPIVESECVKFH